MEKNTREKKENLRWDAAERREKKSNMSSQFFHHCALLEFRSEEKPQKFPYLHKSLCDFAASWIYDDTNLGFA